MLRKELTYGAVGQNSLYVGETAKSHQRRMREGWFDRYIQLPGIDIGCGIDPLHDYFHKWDEIFGDGDATYMDGVPDESFATVYASHILEHLEHPKEAVENWWRILKPGGYLIVLVPHRDLYEKKRELPSRWNKHHKWFWLPNTFEPPCTLSLADVIGRNAVISVLSDGYEDCGEGHPAGEYSIEAIARK